MSSPSEILSFWFSGKTTNRMQKWFYAGSSYDATIRDQFHRVYQEVVYSGVDVDVWCVNANTFLALILLLDQFPRHMFRGTAQAFATDDLAISWLTRSHHLQTHHTYLELFARPNVYDEAVELMFLLMPLQHSTSIKMQILGINTLTRLAYEHKSTEDKEVLELALKHQFGHFNTLRRFNRFPKRNLALRRQSTDDEIEYIAGSKHIPY